MIGSRLPIKIISPSYLRKRNSKGQGHLAVMIDLRMDGIGIRTIVLHELRSIMRLKTTR